MPHFIVEYSSNLARSHDLGKLGELIRDVAVETGVFPLSGVRVRFHPSELYVIADGHRDNAFMSIIVRLGEGRDMETKQRAGQMIYDAVCEFFKAELAGGHFMLSLDLQEIISDVSYKKNTVHTRLSQEQKA